ncbi:MAG: hypothetical protein ACKVI4_03755 [Actinomycetales bacterium]
MTMISVPSFLHDVLGRQQSRSALLLIAVAVAIALLSITPSFGDLELWRSVLAALLLADIAAGAAANLSASVNDHYATRPRSRWIFLAIHVHLVIVALLINAPLMPALIAWAATVAAGTLVNLGAGHATQRVTAGTGLIAILCMLPLLPDQEPALLAISSLFAFKVVFAFAVDHHADCRATESAGPASAGASSL